MKALHFLYHEVRRIETKYSYVVTRDEFAAHCSLFSRLRAGANEGYLLPEITFDDGHLSDVEEALPVLEEFGLRARFFITVGWTGQKPGYMDWAQLRSLSDRGQQIGAHGWSHKLLTHCTETQLREELERPRLELEQKLGIRVDTMSLPGGRSNRRVLAACEQAGYRQVFTSVPKPEEMSAEPKTVGRLNLVGGTNTEWLERVLRPETGALARLYRVDRIKSAGKAVLGDRVYAGLWSLVNRQEPGAAETEAPIG